MKINCLHFSPGRSGTEALFADAVRQGSAGIADNGTKVERKTNGELLKLVLPFR